MLLNLHKKSWMEGLTLQNYNEHSNLNEDTVKDILTLAKSYNKVLFLKWFSKLFFTLISFILQSLEEEEKMTPEQLLIKNVGKLDPKRHLEDKVEILMTANIVQCLGAMLDTIIFK